MRLLVEKLFNPLKQFLLSLLLFCILCNSSWAAQQLIVEPDMGRIPITNAIAAANQSVDLVLYGFTDLDFVKALLRAKNKGRNVRVLLQETPYRAEDENQKAIQALTTSKINLVYPDGDFKLTHQKTFLIDRHDAIVMTFNLTHSTFKNERNFALIVSDPNLVNEIQQVFDSDWQHKKTIVQQPDLVWSPDNSRNKLLSIIGGAKSDISIYTEGLSDYQIVGALAKAARKGIKVRVLTSKFKDHPINKPFDYMTRAGVAIRFDPDYIIHAKVIMIDHDHAVLGSTNLTRASINSNRELSVITHDPAIIKQLYGIFNSDWQLSPASATASSATTVSTIRKPSVDSLLAESLRQITRLAKTLHKYIVAYSSATTDSPNKSEHKRSSKRSHA